jgi:two-component system CitB family response regulator/two-component system response regulator DcuR
MADLKVLIIEDDLRIAEIHRHFTEKIAGFRVCGIADTLSDAEKMIDLLEPDLLLLDLHFPDGSGMDILWNLRRRRQKTDVILITAARESDPLQEAMRGGIFDYMIKPVMFPRFAEAFERFKHHRQLGRQNVLDQQTIDRLLHPGREQAAGEPLTPKGIDPLTLKKIEALFSGDGQDGLSAEDVGEKIGASRTTARRYLEYLTSTGHLNADVVYGAVGRPERRYFNR